VLTGVNYRGVSGSGWLSNVFTVAKIGGILLLILAGLVLASPTQGKPGPPPGLRVTCRGPAPLWGPAPRVWASDGWVDFSFVTGEINKPRRNVPCAMVDCHE
jgi:APA family basic amino acid/polyamine antiporter